MPFTNLLRCKMVRGHLKRFVFVLFLVPDLRAGDAAAQLNELNAVGLIRSRDSRGQVAALYRLGQGDHNDYNC